MNDQVDLLDLGSLPPVLTLKEVAAYLRLSGSHVRELTASGALVSIQAGSRKARRILREDLLAFIESRRTPSSGKGNGICHAGTEGLECRPVSNCKLLKLSDPTCRIPNRRKVRLPSLAWSRTCCAAFSMLASPNRPRFRSRSSR